MAMAHLAVSTYEGYLVLDAARPFARFSFLRRMQLNPVGCRGSLRQPGIVLVPLIRGAGDIFG